VIKLEFINNNKNPTNALNISHAQHTAEHIFKIPFSSDSSSSEIGLSAPPAAAAALAAASCSSESSAKPNCTFCSAVRL
jgi:hypothetical protein